MESWGVLRLPNEIPFVASQMQGTLRCTAILVSLTSFMVLRAQAVHLERQQKGDEGQCESSQGRFEPNL
jgi:hypothetical protein